MAQIGKYKIPRPFQDEDKWFKYFTKKQLIYIAVALVVSIQLVKMGLQGPAIIQFLSLLLSVIIIASFLIFAMVTMPTDKYLWGGGTSLQKLGLRLLRKRFKANRVIYVKHYQGESVKKGGKKRNAEL